MEKYSLVYAKHDKTHCLAPGLFRSLGPNDRKQGKLDIVYEFGEGEYIQFVGYEPLGSDDLCFLQGMVAMAGPEGLILEPEPASELGCELRRLLNFEGTAAQENALVFESTFCNLLVNVGYPTGGSNIKQLRNSLKRLSAVRVIVSGRKMEGSFGLLSYVFSKETWSVSVALNPLITQAIVGQSGYVLINLEEIRALSSGPARILHQRLCGWIDRKSSRSVRMKVLCDYVWFGEVTKSAMRTRKSKIRDALKELEGIGWSVDECAKNKFEIGRP